MAEARGAGRDLDRWLEPFLDALGHKTRRTWAPLYLRGLLGPGERKSLQPMAACAGAVRARPAAALHRQPGLGRRPAVAGAGRAGGPAGGRAGGGAGDRRHGAAEEGHALGRRGAAVLRAAGQAGELPGAGLADAGRQGGAGPVGLRLFLPEEWTGDPARCAAAGVPEEEVVARSKGEIALAELDRLRAAGVRFGLVLADAGYGASAAFRHGLDERGLPGRWASRATRRSTTRTSGWSRPPGASAARCRTRSRATAEAVLAELPWRRVTWRRGTKGPLARALRRDPRPGRRWRDLGQQPPPARRGGLAGGRVARERRAQILPQQPAAADLAARPGARDQGPLGLRAGAPAAQAGAGPRPLRGRSWTGLHRHALMTCIAFAYLQHLRLAGQRSTGPGKNAAPRSGTATIAEPAGGAPRHHGAAVRATRGRHPMSALQAPVPAAA